MIEEIHRDMINGYGGITKTLKRLQRVWDFPKAKEEVTKFVKDCEMYIRSRAERYKPYREL